MRIICSCLDGCPFRGVNQGVKTHHGRAGLRYNRPTMTSSKIVTRFAPSPTGHLHIGGARTALFNWAFARKHGGQFILRIEDTDQARSTAESTTGILQDLAWLGITWDQGPDASASDPYTQQIGPNGPYFQSQRLEIYRKYVQQLLDSGHAYKCFKTAEDLAAEREAAKAEGRQWRYDRTESISLEEDRIAAFEAEGRSFVVRFKTGESDITVHDKVLGDVHFKAQELEDFVILKSDGFPTFHMAVVVDDALMGVTHVLRAQEHLMNTPKHIALQQALGFPTPVYAHMPLIFNADGSKMSKRDKAKAARTAAQQWMKANAASIEALFLQVNVHGVPNIDAEALSHFIAKKSDDVRIAMPVGQALNVAMPEIDVHDFRVSGYLPEVLLNYIALLGWSPKNNIEQFGLDFLQAEFDLERIGKSNAKFDRAKLLAFNGDRIAAMPLDEFITRLGSHLKQFHPQFNAICDDPEKFKLFAQAYQPRSKTLSDPAKLGAFFILSDDAIDFDAKAVKKVLEANNGEGYKALADLLPVLEAQQDWSASALHQAVESFTTSTGRQMGQIAQPLRVALAGTTVSPAIHDTLAILGQASVVARIRRTLAQQQA
jgi:glutamyl/glutaminyl-tRNA synthetase